MGERNSESERKRESEIIFWVCSCSFVLLLGFEFFGFLNFFTFLGFYFYFSFFLFFSFS